MTKKGNEALTSVNERLLEHFRDAYNQAEEIAAEARNRTVYTPYQGDPDRAFREKMTDALHAGLLMMDDVPASIVKKMCVLYARELVLQWRNEDELKDWHLQELEIESSQAAKKERSIFAKTGAEIRHEENHAMKADVFDWLDANFTPGSRSMDDVAIELAGSLVPAKFRTVRDWLTEWRKLRSTGRP